MHSSKFVVIFSGDGRRAFVVDGWNALLRTIRLGLFGGPVEEPNLEEFEQAFAAMFDESNWVHDDAGPWSYSEQYEDGALAIYRLDG
jgi:hypothetical protein